MDNGDKPAFTKLDHRQPPHPQIANGLTKREDFAKAAMQGLLAREINGPSIRDMADTAVTFADALLTALEEG